MKYDTRLDEIDKQHSLVRKKSLEGYGKALDRLQFPRLMENMRDFRQSIIFPMKFLQFDS